MYLKRFLALLLSLLVLIPSVNAFAEDEIWVYVNKRLVSMENKPQIIDGTTLVPIRSIVEAMEGAVGWDEDSKTAMVRLNDVAVSMQINNKNIAKKYLRDEDGNLTNDSEVSVVESSIAPQIINGSVYVPLRAMAEALDCTVDWDGENKIIYVTVTVESGSSSVLFREEGGTVYISGSGTIESLYNNNKPIVASTLPSDVKNIVIENGITGIGSDAFQGFTSLTSITIADSVTTIGSRAFKDCTSLKYVELPDSVTKLNTEAFSGCTSLEGVKLSANLESISTKLFYQCSALKSIDLSVVKGGGNIANNAFSYSALTSVTIPGTLNVGNTAFQRCDNLKSVIMEDGVTSIGSGAFAYNAALEEVTIPESVTSIAETAFNSSETLFVPLKKVICKKGSTADNPELYGYIRNNGIVRKGTAADSEYAFGEEIIFEYY